MNCTDAEYASLTPEQHRNICHQAQSLIELEVSYPVNLYAVLRALPAHELRTVIAVFERMHAERRALARCRERSGVHGGTGR
jgi:hypothetical protein